MQCNLLYLLRRLFLNEKTVQNRRKDKKVILRERTHNPVKIYEPLFEGKGVLKFNFTVKVLKTSVLRYHAINDVRQYMIINSVIIYVIRVSCVFT